VVQRWPELLKRPSPVQRHGLAVVSVAVALGAALLLNRYHVRDVGFPLFLFAIAVSAWYAGPAPGILASFGKPSKKRASSVLSRASTGKPISVRRWRKAASI
jgi:hypothetical protein